jgi:hypothetical protein
MNKRRLAALCATLFLLGVSAPSALAEPNDDQYGNVLAQGQSTPPTSPLSTVKSGGTLPFTGFDLAFALAAGALAVGGGVGLRKLGRKQNPQA